LDYLSAEEATPFLESCTKLMETFNSAGLGSIRPGLDPDQQEENIYKFLIAILKTLNNLSLLEYSKPTAVVFYGLRTILPLITQELLRFPKLCKQYFIVVTTMFEYHTPHIVSLPGDLFTNLMNSLQFAIKHIEPSIITHGLESVNALATFSFETKKKEGKEPLGELHKQRLSHFFEALINFTVFEEVFQMDLIPISSNTFLALICAEEATFRAMVGQLIVQQSDPKTREKITHLFSVLMNGTALSLDRSNKELFQKKFQAFLVQIRSLMHQR